MTEGVSVEREIAAPPERVWALIADMTRMGEWSPENRGGTWLDGATGPAPGGRFKGRNQSGFRRWSTICTVTDCEPGRVFAFDVFKGPFAVARWSYHIEPVGDGCRVTERWTDRRSAVFAHIGGVVSGVRDRAAHNRAGMVATLDRLAAAAEAGEATAS